MKKLLLIILFCLCIKLSKGQIWSALDTGCSFNVRTLLTYNGELYAGGENSYAIIDCIAKWDGTNWSHVGNGIIENYSTRVDALGIYNGELYAGGDISTAAGIPYNNVVKFDGQNWLGVGTDFIFGTVHALAEFKGELYAAGTFNRIGDSTINYIARWNGSSWNSVGAGMNDYVVALTVYKNELYAGGLFSFAGGNYTGSIAKWDGSTWSSVIQIYGEVFSLASNNVDLYVGGFFDANPLLNFNNIVKWDGSNWSGLNGGTNSDVDAMTILNGELYAGGRFDSVGGIHANNIAKWNGKSWFEMGNGTNNEVRAIASLNNDLYVGGYFDTVDNSPINRIAMLKIPCSAFFTIHADSIPHDWVITDYISGTPPLSYSWNWGDGSTSVGATPVHSYDSLGLYNICLSLTDSSGCNSIYCDSSTYLYRTTSTATMINIRVFTSITTEIKESLSEENLLIVYPNPSHGVFHIKNNMVDKIESMEVFSYTGQRIYFKERKAGEIDLSSFSNGIYFYKIISKDKNIKSGRLLKISE